MKLLNKESFIKLLKKELPQLSLEYANQNVVLNSKNFACNDFHKGGVFLFLHFGNFFLSGAALVDKLKLNYTAIASTKNFINMPEDEVIFWKQIHNLANRTYSRDMFLSHEKNGKEMVNFLREGNFLGAAIDVAEVGSRHRFAPFQLLNNTIYLQSGPARLAKLAKVPIYGMSIVYDDIKKLHQLRITGPHDSQNPESAIQQILKEMEGQIRNNMGQLFHDIFSLFSKEQIQPYLLKTHRSKTEKNLPPIKRLKSSQPKSFSPRYESHITSWHQHRDFAYELIRTLKPKTIVELGVHYGDSYFTFCQACEELELDTKLYGIDHWQGDEQAGLYGEEVFEEVKAYNEEFYSENSTLLKMNFEDALDQFEDQSIDLLHIDGAHDYASVKKDFDNWLPKVKKGGAILMHDVLVEREDYGVIKLWEEISQTFETSIHEKGFGLGIVHC